MIARCESCGELADVIYRPAYGARFCDPCYERAEADYEPRDSLLPYFGAEDDDRWVFQ